MVELTWNSRGTLTQEKLRSLLDYDPATGAFTWRIPPCKRFAVGDRAGCVEESRGGGKYVRIGLLGGRHRAHRLAWLYVHGEWPPEMIDHINGDGLDNRIANLRLATNAQNQWNVRRAARSASGVRGVSWCGRRKMWAVNVRTHYETKEDAIAAAAKAEKVMRGEYAPALPEKQNP